MRNKNISWFYGMSTRQILHKRHQAVEMDGELELARSFHRSKYCGRARHLSLHSIHIVLIFERKSAGIERVSLPHQRDGFSSFSLWFVFQVDHPWSLFAPHPDR